MTAFNFHDRWLVDRKLMTLSAEDFRAFVVAGTWSVSNRTDGLYTVEDLALIPFMDVATAERFVATGLWVHGKRGGYSWPGFKGTQTSAAHLKAIESNRVREAERVRKYRAKKRAEELAAQEAEDERATEDDAGQATVRPYVPPDVLPTVRTDVTTPTPTPTPTPNQATTGSTPDVEQLASEYFDSLDLEAS